MEAITLEKRVTAFTDEYGAFGGDISNPTVSTHVIITAIIVEDTNIAILSEAVEKIRKKYFTNSEMKSSSIGKNHARRMRIIEELLPLPFTIFAIVFDKSELSKYIGSQYKKTFYKFINRIVHEQLTKAFPRLTVISDEIGRSEYMESFAKYIKEHEKPMNLLGESEFAFGNSKNNVLIQVADIISGSLAYDFDLHKKNIENPSYKQILSKKITIDFFPRDYKSYIVDTASMPDGDKEIAEICVKQAIDYIEKHSHDDDDDIKAQLIILRYLLFMFVNKQYKSYISTKELKRQLYYTPYSDISTQTFRTKLIGKMRDSGVIISSSQSGYKIPANEAELCDFINHGTTIIMPMLHRLKKCRDIIKLGTMERVDLFNKTEYSSLNKFFE